MRIRTRIALIYTQLTFFIMLWAFAFVYILMIRNTEEVFYDLLWKRAMITAHYNFEKDEMTESAYQGVVESYNSKLNSESHVIINANDGYEIDSLKNIVPNEADLKQLLNGKTIEYRVGDRQHLGIYYPDNEGDFIIIVSAHDTQGAESARNLFKLLFIILIITTIFVYMIGEFYAKKIFSPIVKIINNVKSVTASNLKTADLIEEKGNDELSELSRTFNDMIHRLKEAFDMQNSFIRNASHELRNPLTAIIGETEIALSRERTPQEYIETLETVQYESERLNVMIRALLSLAQTGSDFSRVDKKQVDLAKVIRRTCDNYKDSEFNVDIPDYTEFRITGVEALLSLAFTNIIGNAIKFSSGKPVDIKFEKKENYYVVSVSDKGIGIPYRDLKNIFQPFYRAGNTATYKGTGIGLALSFKIVDLHGGKIEVDSEEGKGTTFRVYFKLIN
ncbi:MAG: HAMP domain-containing histidine kinase [Rikenellaceae bacterium]|nr:HAMP domain-containing histidine kinase [Rikenellaceae bacterium]